MMTTHPLVQALVKSDYSVLTRPDGQSERVRLPAGVDVRAAVLQRATSIAADMGERIELVISGNPAPPSSLVPFLTAPSHDRQQ